MDASFNRDTSHGSIFKRKDVYLCKDQIYNRQVIVVPRRILFKGVFSCQVYLFRCVSRLSMLIHFQIDRNDGVGMIVRF